MGDSLQHRLIARRDRHPDRPALGFFGETGERHCDWLSYRELYDGVAVRAAGLGESGVGAGDTCLIVLPSDRFSAETVLATLQLGGLPLLVAAPPMQQLDERTLSVLRHVASRTDAAALVAPEWMEADRGRLADLRPGLRLHFGESSLRGSGTRPADWVRPDLEAVGGLQLTSGTTGAPRICVWKQRGILAALDGMQAAMQLGDDDRCCNWTPLYHDMGLVNNFFLCLSRGVPLVLLGPQRFVGRPALWLQALSDTGSTLTWAPNFGYAVAAERARESELDGVDLSGVQAFWNAAERIHADTFERFHQRFESYGVRRQALKANFGCAENVGGATFNGPDEGFVVDHVDARALYEDGIAQKLDPADGSGGAVEPVVGCGRTCPGVELEILDADDAPLPDGHVGEIALRTPSRLERYLGDDVSTERAIRGDLLKTGDLGYKRGDELFWVGRTDERMNLRGKKLDPSDFEATLNDVDGLRQGCFAAFDVYSADEGTQAAVLVCEVRDSTTRSPEKIRGEVRRRISLGFGIPLHDVLLVKERSLSKTTSGKRRHLHYKRRYEACGVEAFDTV